MFVIKPLKTKERRPIALLETHSEQSLTCSIPLAAHPHDPNSELVGVRPERSASAPDLSEVRPLGKGKSSAKNPPKTSKSNEHLGRMTRGREKRMREEEELVRAGMEKLVTTGKALAGFSDLEDTQPSFSKPTGSFSSHDLIRGSISDPSLFDEAEQENANDDGVVIVSTENAPIRAESASSRWGFSLNPLAYLQRQTGLGENDAGLDETEPAAEASKSEKNADPQSSGESSDEQDAGE